MTRPVDALRRAIAWIRPLMMYMRCALPGVTSRFVFGGVRYRYLWHPYMTTWRSERAVELAIAGKRLQTADAASTLEIGNVLSNYFRVRHLVVDKYERAPGVVNEDVVDFSPDRQYDLIISVSTLEHVGWDEEPREPLKVLPAIDNLRDHLTEAGELVVTLPRGWNTELDRLIAEDRIPFAELGCLKRVSPVCWEEVDCRELDNIEYGTPFQCANGVFVGVIRKR